MPSALGCRSPSCPNWLPPPGVLSAYETAAEDATAEGTAIEETTAEETTAEETMELAEEETADEPVRDRRKSAPDGRSLLLLRSLPPAARLALAFIGRSFVAAD
eukprot:scaffold90882_cov48-Phaeocystis_antarctica.AAC.1